MTALLAAARGLAVALALPIGSRLARLIVGLVLALAVAAAAGGSDLLQFVIKLQSIVPTLQPSANELKLSSLIPLLAAECAIGLALGLAASLPLYAAESAGLLTDAIVRPALRRGRAPARGPFARLHLLLALAIFAVASGPTLLVDALSRSFAALPVGRAPSAAAGASSVIEIVAALLASAVEIAAPILAAVLLAEIAAGLIARAAPSLSRLLSPAPGGSTARTAAALVALAASASALALLISGGTRDLAARLASTLQLLAP